MFWQSRSPNPLQIFRSDGTWITISSTSTRFHQLDFFDLVYTFNITNEVSNYYWFQFLVNIYSFDLINRYKFVVPDYERISRKAGELLGELHNLVFPPDYNFNPTTKRPANSSRSTTSKKIRPELTEVWIFSIEILLLV